MLRFFRDVRLMSVLLMLALASNVQARGATTRVTSHILSLCGACQVLLIGERHRQPESPMLFIDLVTRLVRQGDRLVVGLEIPAAHQDALDAAMAGERTPAEIAHPLIDSSAYQHMLLELSALQRADGALVTMVAIDDLDSEMARDEVMAHHIQRHLAAGDVERVVVLVGNLHTIQRMPWPEEIGLNQPYLAERLLHADITVTSVMQDLDAACDRLRHPVFYAAAHRQGLDAVSRQLEVVNHPPGMDMHQASDGIVIWECRRPNPRQDEYTHRGFR